MSKDEPSDFPQAHDVPLSEGEAKPEIDTGEVHVAGASREPELSTAELRARRRDSFQVTLDVKWPYIVWKIKHIRKLQDVPKAFRLCVHPGDPLIRLLTTELGPSSLSEAQQFVKEDDIKRAPPELKQLRSHIDALNEKIIDLGSAIPKLQLKLCRAEALIWAQLDQTGRNTGSLVNPSESKNADRIRSIVEQVEAVLGGKCDHELHQSALALAGTADDLGSIQAESVKERAISNSFLNNAEAFYAQLQMLNLVTKGRYRILTPRIVANALAGFAEMGYRASSELYSKSPHKVLDGQRSYYGLMVPVFKDKKRVEGVQYQILRLLTKLVEHIRRRREPSNSIAEVVALASNWLDRCPERTDAGQCLRTNRRVLLRCLRAMERRNLSAEGTPYVLFRRFSYLVDHPSPRQQLLDELNG